MSREELAFRHVYGALTPAERAQVEQLRLFDRALDADIVCAEEGMAPLALAPDGAPVPEGLWTRVEATIAEDAAEAPGMTTEPYDAGRWRAFQPGVDIKPLWDKTTFLVRCAPGACIPEHEHRADERMLVIAGTLQVGGHLLRVGDSQMSPKGTRHGVISSPAGCVLLVQQVREAA